MQMQFPVAQQVRFWCAVGTQGIAIVLMVVAISSFQQIYASGFEVSTDLGEVVWAFLFQLATAVLIGITAYRVVRPRSITITHVHEVHKLPEDDK
jgi:hypothetical protein